MAGEWNDDDGEAAELGRHDALLSEMAHDNTKSMAGAAARIEAEQWELIQQPFERLLIVQGGTGTGKTLAALHRVAQLIERSGGSLKPADVLIVGPSPAYTRYARSVLSSWGIDGVEQIDIARLHCPVAPEVPDRAQPERNEVPYVLRLKGEARMAGLLSRAVRDPLDQAPAELPATITLGGQSMAVDPGQLRRVVATANASRATAGDRRRILRGMLAAAGIDPAAINQVAEILAELVWPQVEPGAFLRRLLGSLQWMTAAAGGEFTPREIIALYRALPGVPGWSAADFPLLDEAAHLLQSGPKQYAHIVVDGVQDLSPMQLRSVARRSAAGSMTVVGDLAQSIGPWVHDSWADIVAHLPQQSPHVRRELKHGYRVPRRIAELAAELLPAAAQSAPTYTIVRDGPDDPVVEPTEPADRARAVVAAATLHAAHGRSVAVICSAGPRAEIEAELHDEDIRWQSAAGEESNRSITLLSPYEAKGLEFDAVVVVEPGEIVEEDPRGHRLLYIALTRATHHLHLVGAGADLPLDFAGSVVIEPAELQVSATPVPAVTEQRETEPAEPQLAQPAIVEPEVEYEPPVQEAIDMLAHTFAEALLGANLTPPLWYAVLRRLERLIAPLDPED